MAAICHHLLTMPALVIKPFPAALHTKLRRIAAEHRRSVTQETIHLLEMAISAADRSNPAAADGQPKWAKRSQCDSLAAPALRLSKPSWERQKWGRPKTARRKTARRKTQDKRRAAKSAQRFFICSSLASCVFKSCVFSCVSKAYTSCSPRPTNPPFCRPLPTEKSAMAYKEISGFIIWHSSELTSKEK
jgi:plasmid stability protein